MQNLLSTWSYPSLIDTDLLLPDQHSSIWQSGLGDLHVVSEFIIALAYYTILVTAIYFMRRGQDLLSHQILLLFSVFLITDATNHLLEASRLWQDTYWLSGSIEVTTAIVSIYTAVTLIFLMPKMLVYSELAATNQKLEAEIAEWRQAEAALQELNQKLEAKIQEQTVALHTINSLQQGILDSTNYAIISSNSEGIIQTFNAGAEKMLGYRQDEVVFRVTPALIHDSEELQKRAEILSMELNKTITPGFEIFVTKASQGISSEEEWNYIRKDGSRFPVLLSVTPLYHPEGEIIGFVTIAKDITQEKQIKAQLIASEAHLRAAQRIANLGSWEFDIETQEAIWSEEMFRIFGQNPAAGMPTYEELCQIIHPEDLPVHQFLREKALLQGESYQYENRIYRPDGTLRYLLTRCEVILGDDGRTKQFVGTVLDITEQKQKEEELSQLSERLTLAVKSGAIGIWQWDIINNVLIWDERMYELYGVSASEAGKAYDTWANSLHPEDKAETELISQLARRGEREFNTEFRVIHPDGTIHFLKAYATIQRDEKGNAIRMIGLNYDITERKQAEESLTKYAREVEDLYNNAPCGYHSLDNEGKFIKINETELRWLGYTSEEMIGESIANFFSETSRLAFWQNYPRFKKQGWIKDIEYEMICKDGTILPVLVSAIAVNDEAGNYLYNRASLFDIRELKEAELTLKKQARREQLLRAITHRVRQSLDVDEILSSAVVEVRKIFQAERALIFRILPEGKGQIIREDVSEAYSLLGDGTWEDLCLNPDSLQYYYVGKPRIVTDVALDEWGNCLGKTLQQLGIRSKISAPIIQRLENGSQIWGLLIVHACGKYRQWLPEEAGFLQQISNQLAIAIQQANLYQRVQSELSERKQAEAKLLKINQELELTNAELARATRLKDEFLANMSHELRTPLNAILGMSEGFQDSVFGELNEKQRKSIATIERSGKHLLELINDILDLSKIESGKLELQISDVPIVSLCEASLAFIKQIAHKKAIEIHTSIPKDIKSIQGDNRHLRQILINLLSNAVKFTPNGGSITLKVLVEEGSQFTTDIKEVYQENHQEIKETSGIIAALSAYSPTIPIAPSSQRLCFSVIDTGIGIAQEDISKLFQAFVQIDSSLNRQYSGTGLGLALVERITTLHGGTVSVTSQVGKGSCFSIRLPYHPGSEAVQRESGSQLPNQSLSEHPLNSPITVSETTLKDALILLVEDNPANIDTISAYLEGRGYRVIVAKDGYQAVSLAQTEDPNLILMDIQMPGMDGLEAMRRIRDRGQTQVPIIALTALAMCGDREKCMEAGANEYLTKPIKFKQLTVKIQQLLLNAEKN